MVDDQSIWSPRESQEKQGTCSVTIVASSCQGSLRLASVAGRWNWMKNSSSPAVSISYSAPPLRLSTHDQVTLGEALVWEDFGPHDLILQIKVVDSSSLWAYVQSSSNSHIPYFMMIIEA